MTKKDEYEIKFWSSWSWLSQSEMHKFIAEEIFLLLKPRLEHNVKSFDEAKAEEFVSLVFAYKFHIGLAFENLAKALIISKLVSFGNRIELKDKYSWSYKHDIKKMIETNFRILRPEEVIIVDDIQQILKWRGKYELPNDHEEEIPETLIRSQDKGEIDNIFSNILSETNRFIEMNKSYYFEWSDSIKGKYK